MVEAFKDLSEEEVQQLIMAPVVVSVLIAGADGKIDNKEKSVALSIAKLKTYRARKVLIDYYNDVNKVFESEMNNLIAEMPENASERNPLLVERLELLNNILPKIEKKFAIHFYESLKDFAKQIAEASGGILNMLSVSVEESKYMQLKMIRNPENY